MSNCLYATVSCTLFLFLFSFFFTITQHFFKKRIDGFYSDVLDKCCIFFYNKKIKLELKILYTLPNFHILEQPFLQQEQP